MFERFTDRARRVLVIAQDEALELEHPLIRPEHLLLGLAKGDGVGSDALTRLGTSFPTLREQVALGLPRSEEPLPPGSKVPFSPRSKKCLELALREALRLGHNYIGTEHLLLGLVREGGRGEDSVVRLLGVSPDEVRDTVLRILSSGPLAPYTRPRSPRTPPGPSPGAVDDDSPALRQALTTAHRLAGSLPPTTGHLALALMADPASQAAKALARLGVTSESLQAELAHVPVEGTSDAPPEPVEIRLGTRTVVLDDPELAARARRLVTEHDRARRQEADQDDGTPGPGTT